MFLSESNLPKPKVRGTSLNAHAMGTNITVDVDNLDIQADKKHSSKDKSTL